MGLVKRLEILESVARLAIKASEADLQDPMQLILLNVQLANIAALAKMGLAKSEHHCEIDDGTRCEECCQHFDMDGGQCLDCGTDRTEDMMADAYDRAKAARQDD